MFPFRYQVSCLDRSPPRAIVKTPSLPVVVPFWPGSRWNSTYVSGQHLLMCADKVARNIRYRQAKETLWQESVSVQSLPSLSPGKGFLFLKTPSWFISFQSTASVHVLSPLGCMDTERHLTKKPRRCHFHAKLGSSGSPVNRGVLWASRDRAVPRHDLPLVLWPGRRKVRALLLRRLWREPEQLWLGGILHGGLWQHQ